MTTPVRRARVVVAAARTPIGTAGRALAGVDGGRARGPAAGPVGRAVPEAARGGAGQLHGPRRRLARVASLAAGLPFAVPAITVDRQCGVGARRDRRRGARCAVGAGRCWPGGSSRRRTAPRRYWPPDAPPERYERAPFAPADIGDPEMGRAADLLAAEGRRHPRAAGRLRRPLARARPSAARARARRGAGAVGGVTRRTPRPGLTRRRWHGSGRRSSRAGRSTAGNSCGVSDGAAGVALVPAPTARLPGLRVRATAAAGVRPGLPGLGPYRPCAPARPRRLRRRRRRGRAHRGVRRAGAGLLRRARARPGRGLSRGRGDRARASLGRVRRRAHGAAVHADGAPGGPPRRWPRARSAAAKASRRWWSGDHDRVRRRHPPVRRPPVLRDVTSRSTSSGSAWSARTARASRRSRGCSTGSSCPTRAR